MKITFAAIAMALAFTIAPAQAEQYRIVGVMDGDTVRALSGSHQQVKCRLFAIDAPEKNMPYGQRSKDSLSDMVFNKMVDIEIVDHDQYGRSVCRLSLNGVDVNKVQVQRGMAWEYKRFSKDASYGQAEKSARQQKLGLWADANPVPPWEFRRNERSSHPRF